MTHSLQLPWYWRLDTTDARGCPVHVRCLVRAGDRPLAITLKSPDASAPTIAAARRALLLALADTLWTDPATRTAEYWTCYPSSTGVPRLPTAISEAGIAFGLFPGRYLPDMFVRHRPAVRASVARRTVGDPGFLNQVNTVHLHPKHANTLFGRHVLVLDDFCTCGHSLEWARLLLLSANARRVDGISIGRYGIHFTMHALRPGIVLDPWHPTWLAGDAFIHTPVFRRRQRRSRGWHIARIIFRSLWHLLVGVMRIAGAVLQLVAIVLRAILVLLAFARRYE